MAEKNIIPYSEKGVKDQDEVSCYVIYILFIIYFSSIKQ